MNLELDLVADYTLKGRIYPALARHQARPYTQSWREFDSHWPYTTPLRLQEYCDYHGLALKIHRADHFPSRSYYPICLSFFDFSIDYFSLMPAVILEKLTAAQLKILFMYHEGDNPESIKKRLDSLCDLHRLDRGCYVFVSANSAADALPGFVTFHDFELWYFHRNLGTPALEISALDRCYDFTALCRIHKSWRMTAMADLWRRGLLDSSLWSYCESPSVDHMQDCAIQPPTDLTWPADLDQFRALLPHYSDNFDQQQRNDHSKTIDDHFQKSWCNIVLESQFDVDNSNGVFLTEKTFKPIKHGQMFFIVGAAGSLAVLRDLGYRVFDNILDNSYDLEHDSTARWHKLIHSVIQAKNNLPTLHQQALHDIKHNQSLFLANKADRLNRLIEKIHDAHSK